MKRISLFSRSLMACLCIGSFAGTGTAQAETVVATATLTISGTVYMVPECTINNNQPIVVDFGTLKIPELETTISPSATRNQVTKSVPVSCGDTATAPLEGYALKMKIEQKKASFNGALLGTSNDNLGIYVLAGASGSETAVVPNQSTTMNTGGGGPDQGAGSFIFVPVANNAHAPAAGPFDGNATMTIFYE
ncbi:MAG TPA: fimbrial protein [Buttiauxella sp.]|jgi:type 1 fimbria pilin